MGWEYTDKNYVKHVIWCDCPCCNGSGIMRKALTRPTGRRRVSKAAAVVLNGVTVLAENIQTLADTLQFLDIKEVTILSLDKVEPCLIRIAEGIDFIFMPQPNLSATSVSFITPNAPL